MSTSSLTILCVGKPKPVLDVSHVTSSYKNNLRASYHEIVGRSSNKHYLLIIITKIMSDWAQKPIKNILLDINGVLFNSGEPAAIAGSVEAMQM